MKKRNGKNPFKDLYNLLTEYKKPLHIKQLMDGRAYVYSKDYLLASFRYYGGINITDLKLNTKNFIGKEIYRSLHMADYLMAGGDKLNLLLKSLLPDAKLCIPTMKHAYEFSIIEAALLDTNTRIELSNIKPTMYDVALVNYSSYVSCSFRYYKKGKMIKHIFLRYHSRVPDVKLEKIMIPSCKVHIFDDLLNRKLIPIE